MLGGSWKQEQKTLVGKALLLLQVELVHARICFLECCQTIGLALQDAVFIPPAWIVGELVGINDVIGVKMLIKQGEGWRLPTKVQQAIPVVSQKDRLANNIGGGAGSSMGAAQRSEQLPAAAAATEHQTFAGVEAPPQDREDPGAEAVAAQALVSVLQEPKQEEAHPTHQQDIPDTNEEGNEDEEHDKAKAKEDDEEGDQADAANMQKDAST